MNTLNPHNILVEILRQMENTRPAPDGWIVTVPQSCLQNGLDLLLQHHTSLPVAIRRGHTLMVRAAPAPRQAELVLPTLQRIPLKAMSHLLTPPLKGLPPEGLLFVWDGPQECWVVKANLCIHRGKLSFQTGEKGTSLQSEDVLKYANFHAIYLEKT